MWHCSAFSLYSWGECNCLSQDTREREKSEILYVYKSWGHYFWNAGCKQCCSLLYWRWRLRMLDTEISPAENLLYTSGSLQKDARCKRLCVNKTVLGQRGTLTGLPESITEMWRALLTEWINTLILCWKSFWNLPKIPYVEYRTCDRSRKNCYRYWFK